MLSSKIWAPTVLWLLLPLSSIIAQNSTDTPLIPKWEFGLRAGAGFDMTHVVKEGYTYYIYPEGRTTGSNYLGGYATRNFNQRWSLRTELSAIIGPKPAFSVGVYPRYYLTKWLGLEAGIEARNLFEAGEKNHSKVWLGTALRWKGMELNVRYSPSFVPKAYYSQTNWQHSVQVGMSFNLAKVGKVFGGKN